MQGVLPAKKSVVQSHTSRTGTCTSTNSHQPQVQKKFQTTNASAKVAPRKIVNGVSSKLATASTVKVDTNKTNARKVPVGNTNNGQRQSVLSNVKNVASNTAGLKLSNLGSRESVQKQNAGVQPTLKRRHSDHVVTDNQQAKKKAVGILKRKSCLPSFPDDASSSSEAERFSSSDNEHHQTTCIDSSVARTPGRSVRFKSPDIDSEETHEHFRKTPNKKTQESMRYKFKIYLFPSSCLCSWTLPT